MKKMNSVVDGCIVGFIMHGGASILTHLGCLTSPVLIVGCRVFIHAVVHVVNFG